MERGKIVQIKDVRVVIQIVLHVQEAQHRAYHALIQIFSKVRHVLTLALMASTAEPQIGLVRTVIVLASLAQTVPTIIVSHVPHPIICSQTPALAPVPLENGRKPPIEPANLVMVIAKLARGVRPPAPHATLLTSLVCLHV